MTVPPGSKTEAVYRAIATDTQASWYVRAQRAIAAADAWEASEEGRIQRQWKRAHWPEAAFAFWLGADA